MIRLTDITGRLCAGVMLVLIVSGLLWLRTEQSKNRLKAQDEADKIQTYYMTVDSGYCEMSFYSAPEHGRKTAFTEIFDSLAYTCAIDFNTPIFYNDWLEISYKDQACTVRVNDRMSPEICLKFPFRDIDLAQAPAARMGMLTEGVRYMTWRKIVK